MFIIYMFSFIVSMIYIFFVKAEYKNYKCQFIYSETIWILWVVETDVQEMVKLYSVLLGSIINQT